MSSDELDDPIFKALASSTRRSMLDCLRDDSKTTSELCAHFPDLNRCTVMQHLSVLEAADLVIVQRKGRVRWNYFNPLPIKGIHDRWIGPYAKQAVDLLQKLKSDLETEPVQAQSRAI